MTSLTVTFSFLLLNNSDQQQNVSNYILHTLPLKGLAQPRHTTNAPLKHSGKRSHRVESGLYCEGLNLFKSIQSLSSPVAGLQEQFLHQSGTNRLNSQRTATS